MEHSASEDVFWASAFEADTGMVRCAFDGTLDASLSRSAAELANLDPPWSHQLGGSKVPISMLLVKAKQHFHDFANYPMVASQTLDGLLKKS